ncbi:MAG: acyltransferase [Chitinophagales bacterium]
MGESHVQNHHKHIPHLDGIRGMSILLVMASHFFAFVDITEIGWVGVDSFFVLSGFLITGILLDAKERPFYFRNFYVKRLLRIFPLYYLILLLVLFILPMLAAGLVQGLDYFRSNQLWFWTYLQNWLFGHKGWPPSNLLSHTWSLAVEEQYYMFWPVMVFLLSRNKILILCVILFCLSPLIRQHYPDLPFAYMNTFARLEGLILGSAIAVLMKSGRLNFRKLAPLIYLGMLLILIHFISLEDLDLARLYNIKVGYTLSSVFFALLLMATFVDNKIGSALRQLFSSRVLTFTGKISYGLYVYHMILYVLLEADVKAMISENVENSLLLNVLTGSLFTLASYLISYISFHVFEVKFTNMKSRFVK